MKTIATFATIASCFALTTNSAPIKNKLIQASYTLTPGTIAVGNPASKFKSIVTSAPVTATPISLVPVSIPTFSNCFKKAYGIGVGTVPTSCNSGYTYSAGLCY